jgi:GDPmannose 4,6-dehydratase
MTKLNKNPIIVKVDPQYFRPTEVDLLIGDPSKARQILGWEPKYNLSLLISDMMHNDINIMRKEICLKESGFNTFNYNE